MVPPGCLGKRDPTVMPNGIDFAFSSLLLRAIASILTVSQTASQLVSYKAKQYNDDLK